MPGGMSGDMPSEQEEEEREDSPQIQHQDVLEENKPFRKVVTMLTKKATDLNETKAWISQQAASKYFEKVEEITKYYEKVGQEGLAREIEEKKMQINEKFQGEQRLIDFLEESEELSDFLYEDFKKLTDAL